jgi:hypothetical protein
MQEEYLEDLFEFKIALEHGLAQASNGNLIIG